MSSLKERVEAANTLLEKGATLEVMAQFYAENVTMQENENPPRVGKAFCMEHERKNLTKVKDLKIVIENQAIDEAKGVVFTALNIQFTVPPGVVMQLKEVSVQHWEDGWIQQEKFYYKEIFPTAATQS